MPIDSPVASPISRQVVGTSDSLEFQPGPGLGHGLLLSLILSLSTPRPSIPTEELDQIELVNGDQVGFLVDCARVSLVLCDELSPGTPRCFSSVGKFIGIQ